MIQHFRVSYCIPVVTAVLLSIGTAAGIPVCRPNDPIDPCQGLINIQG